MQVIGVSFIMDEGIILVQFLQFQLYYFEDEVWGIVDKVVKEMGMEKVLKELQIIWVSMEFQYEFYQRINVFLLRLDEDFIEVLEDN